LYKSIGDREAIALVVIDKAVAESVKAVTARYFAEELITKRVEVKKGIQEVVISFIEETLVKKGLSGSIDVANVAITNFDFSKEFNDSIEAKVRAEQDALRAANEKKTRVTNAEAKATEVRLASEAESYKRKQEADGKAYEIEAESISRAEAIKREGAR
jgi:regulator of protease activity HflC (stomatin/prohibitin superfamily)